VCSRLGTASSMTMQDLLDNIDRLRLVNETMSLSVLSNLLRCLGAGDRGNGQRYIGEPVPVSRVVESHEHARLS